MVFLDLLGASCPHVGGCRHLLGSAPSGMPGRTARDKARAQPDRRSRLGLVPGWPVWHGSSCRPEEMPLPTPTTHQARAGLPLRPSLREARVRAGSPARVWGGSPKVHPTHQPDPPARRALVGGWAYRSPRIRRCRDRHHRKMTTAAPAPTHAPGGVTATNDGPRPLGSVISSRTTTAAAAASGGPAGCQASWCWHHGPISSPSSTLSNSPRPVTWSHAGPGHAESSGHGTRTCRPSAPGSSAT